MGKPESPEKNLPKQKREQTRNSTHMKAESGNRSPGHIGGVVGGGGGASALTTAPSLLPRNIKFPLTYIVCEVYTISASRAWSSSV